MHSTGDKSVTRTVCGRVFARLSNATAPDLWFQEMETCILVLYKHAEGFSWLQHNTILRDFAAPLREIEAEGKHTF